MIWTAVVPLKLGTERKTRLAGTLDPAARQALSDHMARHVLATLKAVPSVGQILLLAPECPDWADAEWRQDAGRGLNAELSALGDAIDGPLLVIHADLPLVAPDDIQAVLASGGDAIAPDRHGSGTNALALANPAGFPFAFGAESCGQHRAARPGIAFVQRSGLAVDVDTADDLAVATAAGFKFPL